MYVLRMGFLLLIIFIPKDTKKPALIEGGFYLICN